VGNLQTIGVLAGGDSPEREVSLISGRSVHQALSTLGYSPSLIEISSLDDLVPSLRGVELVFNCLHGGSGEDGTVQLLLDLMGIPYPGSGPQACARAMDKARAKEIFSGKRIPTPKWSIYDGDDPGRFAEKIEDSLSYPLVAKPRRGGSTIGVAIVEGWEELLPSLIGVRGGELLVEEFVPGRELTVGILRIDGEDRPLPIVESSRSRGRNPCSTTGRSTPTGSPDSSSPPPSPMRRPGRPRTPLSAPIGPSVAPASPASTSG